MQKENAGRDALTGLRIPAREEEIHPVTLSKYSAAAGRELPNSVVRETKHHILDARHGPRLRNAGRHAERASG
jgi:hypothetical protein